MANKSPINVRMNKKLKLEGGEYLNALGLTPTDLVTLFLKECVKENGLPFEVKYKPSIKYNQKDGLLQVKVDSDAKDNGGCVLRNNGLDISKAITLLYIQMIEDGAIPF